MFWGSRQDKERSLQGADQAKAGQKLPTELQQLVDRDEDFYGDLYSS